MVRFLAVVVLCVAFVISRPLSRQQVIDGLCLLLLTFSHTAGFIVVLRKARILFRVIVEG